MTNEEAAGIWSDDVAARLLHILPQQIYHDTVVIYGAKDALRRLGNALISAAETGLDVELKDVMASDGEGYCVVIKPCDQWQMAQAPMPYAQIGLPWEFESKD